MVRCFFSFLLYVDRYLSFCDRMLTVGCDSLFVVRVVCSLFVVRCLLFACCLLFVVRGLLLFVVSRLSCAYR